MSLDDLITIDPGILGGTPVFKGTRVPVRTLLEYLESIQSLLLVLYPRRDLKIIVWLRPEPRCVICGLDSGSMEIFNQHNIETDLTRSSCRRE